MKIVFFAKVTPERFGLTASEMRYRAIFQEINFSYEARISIHVGQVVVQIIFGDSQPDILTIKNLVEGDIRQFVDYYGFFHGVRFDVDMISAVDDAGNWHVFGIDIPVLKEALQGCQDELLKKYFSCAIGKPECSVIMADFREAMRNPPNTGFHCYRAIETMMQTMKEISTEDNNRAWGKFRSNLNIDRNCLDAIKNHADPPRHGKLHAMTDSQRAYVFKKTQVIVLRFFEYLIRDERPLPEAEFPILQP